MLRWRLLSASLIIGVLLGLTWADLTGLGGASPGVWLVPFFVFVLLAASHEVLDLLAAQDLRPVRGPVYLGVVAVTFGALHSLLPAPLRLGFPHAEQVITASVAGSMMLVFIVEMRRYDGSGGNIVRIALAIMTIVYIGVLGGYLAALRFFESNGIGMAALVSTLFIVKASDAGAYFFGRSFGRTKLTPKLSPGKTVEGAIGGAVTACIAAWCFFHFIAPRMIGDDWMIPSLSSIIVYGLLLSLAGMFGDLAESLLKRDMGRKDSSTWLPGLGGVLDIFDAVLFGAPTAYYCWYFGLI